MTLPLHKSLSPNNLTGLHIDSIDKNWSKTGSIWVKIAMIFPVITNLRNTKVRNSCLAVYQCHLISCVLCLAEHLAINELIGNSHKAVELASEHLVLKLVNTEEFLWFLEYV